MLIVVAACVVIAAFVTLFAYSSWDLRLSPIESIEVVDSATPSAPSREEGLSNSADHSGSTHEHSGDASGTGTGELPVVPGHKPKSGRTIRVVVVDQSSGESIAGARLQYGQSNPFQLRERGKPVALSDLAASLITDEKGVAEIEASGVDFVIVGCADTELTIIRDSADRYGWAYDQWLEPGLQVVGLPVSEVEFRVRCRAAGAVQVRCQYSDGLPVAGTVSYTLWREEPRRMAAQLKLWHKNGIPLDQRGVTVIQGVPFPSFIQVVVASSRNGWPATKSIRQPVDASTREISVVLPEEERRGAILRLTFNEVPADTTLRVRVIDQYSFPQADFMQTGDGIWMSKPMSLPKVVRVYVEGDLAWTSGEIELTDERVSDVDIAPARPATLCMQVLDDQHSPVVPAVVLRYARQTVSWENPQHYVKPLTKGAFATADALGAIRFEGLAAGRQALVIQAKGFEAKQVSYFAKPGETVDLGAVVLRRYVGDEGKVRVQISGEGDFNGLVCGVMAYGNGAACKAIQVPSSGELVFADLHYGKYVVYARGVLVKGSLWQQAFELTPESPSAEVKLDIAKPPKKTPTGD